MNYIEILFILLFIHALADFALQSDVMAKGKNRHSKIIPPIGEKHMPVWVYFLSAHALIHGGLIMLVFGNIWIALIEFISHFIIDFLKCENKTNPHQDQVMHLILKIIYGFIL